MELKYLNSYSPAEILLLRNGYTVNLTDILKYTVIDLLFKDVIHFELVQHFEMKNKFFIQFSKGDNFNDYQPKKQEQAFIHILSNIDGILLEDYLKKYFHHFKNEKKIKNLIVENYLNVYFERSLIDGIFNKYSRKSSANVMFNDIDSEIKSVEFYLNQNIDVSKKTTLLQQLYGNILFLDDEHIPIVKEVEREILKQLNKKNDDDFDLDIFDSGFSTDLFNTSFTFFDDIDFDGVGGGDFGGGGADGGWDLLDAVSDIDFD
jgi:hypothetical protein